MKKSKILSWILILRFLVLVQFAGAQLITNINLDYSQGLKVNSLLLEDSALVELNYPRPLYSFLLNGKPRNSGEVSVARNGTEYIQIYDNGLQVKFNVTDSSGIGSTGQLLFENTGKDTLTISNVIPYGDDSASVHITGKGPSDLARAWLFRPGFKPLRVILPDNAWELGYTSFTGSSNYSVCSIIRRKSVDRGVKKRYESVLPPDASLSLSMHTELFKGDWQNGLRKIFRDRYIYDVEKFDNSLFEREDLAWIKESYLIVLQMAWDREFYDRFSGKYAYADFLKKWFPLFGNIDVFGIWPTWPRLGLDQRNQWDLYRDLPGGTRQLSSFIKMSRLANTRFFISYNPWDNSTRKEAHFRGMAKLIAETEADGVVLDTRGSSGPELQEAVDSIRKGVIMYSEGMAVPYDMQGIISGRVHNAIFLSPELNLNKLIKPDFAIFRVCDVGEDILHREIAIAFFNGYGTELNMFRPGGRDESFSRDLEFLSRTTFILRQNSDAFIDRDWTPLISTTTDGVYVNSWKSGRKTIYTVLNMNPDGAKGRLFSPEYSDTIHYISLWNHENIKPEIRNGKAYIEVNAEGWDPSLSGTRGEGSVECIAVFPNLIRAEISGDSLKVAGEAGDSLIIWKGNPAHNASSVEIKMPCDTTIRIKDLFGYYEGKIVIQLIGNKKLEDELVLRITGGKPLIYSKFVPTLKSDVIPPEMVLVPGSLIALDLSGDDDFIAYPDLPAQAIKVDSFLIDKYPVTNSQYYDFITASGYRPSDTSGYLRHWQSGIFRQGQDKYPVVNLSYEDMSAYARWAGKRLPSQAEWQLAAQGTDKREWPWGNDFHATYCNNSFNRLTPVDAFPKGQSPYGVMDMVGNVWQMTNDIYFNGTYYMGIIRGGSFYKPESSWWYLQGGPQALNRTQVILLVSPGFDRSSTVGFRCVKDIDSKNFKIKK